MEEKNRYTRLKSIKEFGYDIEWDDLKKFHIGIIGIGGLGTITAEIAARCGVGRISLFDFDKVDVVNLNRMFFKPNHIGQYKVIVAKKMLEEINPDVEIFVYNNDIMDNDFNKKFESKLKEMDIVLMGLDNVPARELLNYKCVKLNIPYIDAAASRSGFFGYVQPIIPYKTACTACQRRNIVKNIPQEKGEPCVASLPSTMAILASLQIQEMLKYLLKFGKSIDYIFYNMLSGEFTHYKVNKSPECLICSEKYEHKDDINEMDEKRLIKELSKSLEELNE